MSHSVVVFDTGTGPGIACRRQLCPWSQSIEIGERIIAWVAVEGALAAVFAIWQSRTLVGIHSFSIRIGLADAYLWWLVRPDVIFFITASIANKGIHDRDAPKKVLRVAKGRG